MLELSSIKNEENRIIKAAWRSHSQPSKSVLLPVHTNLGRGPWSPLRFFDVIYPRELVCKFLEFLKTGRGPEYDVCEIQPLSRDFVLRNWENPKKTRFSQFLP